MSRYKKKKKINRQGEKKRERYLGKGKEKEND